MKEKQFSVQPSHWIAFIMSMSVVTYFVCFYHASSEREKQQLSSDYYIPVRFSPHRKYVLLKNKKNDDFNMAVYDTSNGVRTHVHTSKRSQISVHFSPNEEKLIFQIRNSSNVFELYLLKLTDMSVRKLNAPSSLSGLPSFYWSPDSSELAYYEVRKEETILHIDNVNDMNWPQISIRGMNEDSVLTWSSNGEELLVAPSKEGNILLKLKRNGEVLSRYNLNQRIKINEIVWNSVDEILLVNLPLNGEFYQLSRLNLNSGDIETLVSENADIEEPMMLENKNSILYHSSYRGVTQLKVFDMKSGLSRTLSKKGEVGSWIQNIEDHGRSLYGITYSYTEQPKLVKINIESGESELVFTEALTEQIKIPASKMIELNGVESTFRAHLWEPDAGVKPENAIIYIHGGPASNIGPEWNREYANLVKNGWAILAPNYHGSSSEGASFSVRKAVSIQVADVVASIKYMRNYLPVKSKLFLAGQSFGSRLVLEALREVGNDIDGVILTSTITGLASAIACDKLPSYIVSFHGGEDYINSAEKIRKYLNGALGDSSFKFQVLPEEGHILQRESSTNAIRSAIFGGPQEIRLSPRCGVN